MGLPRWSLDSIYQGFDDLRYSGDVQSFSRQVAAFRSAVEARGADDDVTAWLHSCIKSYNGAADTREQLSSYADAVFTTDTRDWRAAKEINKLEELSLPLKSTMVTFRNRLAQLGEAVEKAVETDPKLSEYTHFLDEERKLQQRQMSATEEDLAEDLSRAGGSAWGRLQESISSNLSVVWDESNGERKTVTQLRALAMSKERSLRRRALEAEIAAWKSAEIPLAAAVNGVKGFTLLLDRRRGYTDALEKPLVQSRITRKSLDALLGVMQESLPVFRRYLRAKAKRLGLSQLCFYDLFAPVGAAGRVWSFDEAKEFVVEHFEGFSAKLGAFAQHAFNSRWIDAEPREGKIGGAYCTTFPLAKESRVLCNFDGTFSAMSTIAHELGHAYHQEVLKDADHIHRSYPMTLAETASIFSQTVVFEAALRNSSAEERIHLIEEFLQDATQVVVDILSRYLFEKELFDRRVTGEASPEELCSMMIDAQKKSYGDALGESCLHPYMWAVKSHYYVQNLAFYNFPYAFGLLFGLGLVARYREEATTFADTYESILGQTGSASANAVVRDAGFDIEERDFWRSAVRIVERYVSEFESM